MKKVYQSPKISFESFVMSTNIAANCEQPFVGPARNTCGISAGFGPDILFVVNPGTSNCNAPGDKDTTNNDGMCYHNPNPEYNMFNS